MIAIDTSVLVRYLVGSPSEQAGRAADLIDGIDGAEGLGLPLPVLLETVHVLRTQYGVRREAVLDRLLEVCSRRSVRVLGLSDDATIEALARARLLPAFPIADALIVATAREAGAASVASFDRGMALLGIDVVEP